MLNYGDGQQKPVGTYDWESKLIVSDGVTVKWDDSPYSQFQTCTVSIKRWEQHGKKTRMHRTKSIQKLTLNRENWQAQIKMIYELLEDLNDGTQSVESIDWQLFKKRLRFAA